MNDNKNLLLGSVVLCEDESIKTRHINKLEAYMLNCKNNLNRGNNIVSDITYNTLEEYLSILHKDSPLLLSSYVIDKNSVDFSKDLDKFLEESPLLSIPMVKSVKDSKVLAFKNKLHDCKEGLFCYLKLKGCSVRLIYKEGVLVKATTRDKGERGKDITSQVISILGRKNKALKSRGLVELRGDIVLPLSKRKEAKTYIDDFKNSKGIIMSLLEKGRKDDCLYLLDIIFTDIVGDMFSFDNIVGKFQYIENIGLKTPLALIETVEKYSLEEDLLKILGKMEVHVQNYDYKTEGVLISIDNVDTYKSFGTRNGVALGSFILKDGYWKDIFYTGKIKDIKWVNEGNKKVPIALLEKEVLIEGSVLIDKIPLYAPCYILMLEAYKSKNIHFRYMGSLGTVLCDKKGNLVVNPLN